MGTTITQVGGLPFPTPGPVGTASVGDPGLDVLLSFARAVIRAQVGTAWAALAPDDGDVVKGVYPHNPNDIVFREGWLPALFGWRTNGDIETIAADYDIETSRLTVLWVFPTANQEVHVRRSTLVNAVGKALNASLKRGRHPAWIAQGDIEPQAAINGSFLWEQAGWWSLVKSSWELTRVLAEKDGDTATVKSHYPAVQWTITVTERVQTTDADDHELHGDLSLVDANDQPVVTLELEQS